MKKIKLFTDHNQSIQLDLERLEKKIDRLNELLNQSDQERNIFQRESQSYNFNKINERKIVEYITLLLNDFGIHMNFKEVQNIVKKANPQDSQEQNIINLKDVLNLFWIQPKMIHQGNVSMLYKLLTNDNKNFSTGNIFRSEVSKVNDSKVLIQISDFEQIPVFFNQLIEFINDQNSHISPFIDMQIIQLHSLAISPFKNYNFLISKILSIWYFIGYKDNYNDDLMSSKFPIDSYLEILELNKERYLTIINNCLKLGDYTDFIDVIAGDIIKYQQDKQITEKINTGLHRKNIFLAVHEKKFLFAIIYHDMQEFDWKWFKNVSKFNASKQFIIRNLSHLEGYGLLISRMIKNRKFFYKSDQLRSILYEYKG